MRLLLASLSFIVSTVAFAASPASAPTVDPVQRLVELSYQESVPPTDARVTAVRAQLQKAVKLTGEEPMAVVAACVRAARFLFDATKVPVAPVDVLDAVAAHGKGRPLADTVGLYVEKRRNSASKTHAETMGAMR